MSTEMPELTISISEETSIRLAAEAKRQGIQPQELAQAILEESLHYAGDEFRLAARYVLDKNKELYKRLA